MKRTTFILIAACCIFTITKVFGVDVTNLVLATGSERGIYYGLGTNIAEVAKRSNLTVEVLRTQGSRENLLLLAKGGAQFCIAQSDVIHEALVGPNLSRSR